MFNLNILFETETENIFIKKRGMTSNLQVALPLAPPLIVMVRTPSPGNKKKK